MEKANKRQLKNIKRLLKEKKVRDFEKCFIAEGEKIVKDIASKGYELDSLFVSNGFAEKEKNAGFISGMGKKDVPVYGLSDAEFDKVSALRNSQGVLAVVKRSGLPRFSRAKNENVLVVLCDSVQDPGNLGTIIRVAAAMEADSVLLSGECADPFNPKVVRASSGTITDIPLKRCSIADLDRLKKDGFKVFAGQPSRKGAKDISKIVRTPGRCVIVFGSEGKGISREVLKKTDHFFFIPTSAKVESLNVTSAAAVSLYVFRKNMKRG